MDIIEFKRRLLDTGLFMKTSGDGQYRCVTCPFCGDTKKHMYVKIVQGTDDPVVYRCFKCNSQGLMKQDWLDYFGIDLKIPPIKGRRRIQPNSTAEMIADLVDPEKHASMIEVAKEYINFRIGVIPTLNDLKAFQLIGDPFGYVQAYLGGDNWGLKDRVWFRMHNGSMAGRALNDDVSPRWRKRGGGSVPSGGLYVIKTPVNTEQTINICICEGVMDAIGLYYHNFLPNALYIACMGSDYGAGLRHALSMGVFGDSVCINIFRDSDVNLIQVSRYEARMFKSIVCYKNAIGKDFGVKKELIELEKHQDRIEKGVYLHFS